MLMLHGSSTLGRGGCILYSCETLHDGAWNEDSISLCYRQCAAQATISRPEGLVRRLCTTHRAQTQRNEYTTFNLPDQSLP